MPLRSVARRVEELYALSMAAYADEPADEAHPEMPQDEWLRDDFHLPDLSPDGSIVAIVDGRVASYSLLTTDGVSRAENEFTGTLPAYRRRGLATLCKLKAIEWARDHGVREIWTGNDAENEPMLSINRRLGYRVAHVRVQHARSL